MQCKQCAAHFEVPVKMTDLLKRVSPKFTDNTTVYNITIPTPSFCPDCRQQQRLAFRNERKLYHDNCDQCGSKMLSIFSPDKNITAYCNNCWWSDGWNALNYGISFEPNRSFLDQVTDLWRKVPKLALLQLCETYNSEYTHDVQRVKNCYLVYDGEQGIDSAYGETFYNIKSSIDFLMLLHSELCYECTNCTNCYNLSYSRFSQNCSDSMFLLDCIGCRNCFGCVNLHQKEYYIFNEPYSKDEYVKKISAYNTGSYNWVKNMSSIFDDFARLQPKKEIRGTRNEDVTGDNLLSCKDTFDSYDSYGLRDCMYCTNMLAGASDCCDVNIWGNDTVLVYNSACIGENAQNIIGCYYVFSGASNVYYSAFCSRNVHNLIGCVGLMHKEYCILNKQYTKKEYSNLLPQIMMNLSHYNQLGNFLPPSMSDFGYNETPAQEYYPLTKNDAILMGFKWSDYSPPSHMQQTLKISSLPDLMDEVSDDILEMGIECEATQKPFRITKQELDFYRLRRIPLPRRHPDQRHMDRMCLRNPRTLWNRSCDHCKTKIHTTYSPNRPDPVYCTKCYQNIFFS